MTNSTETLTLKSPIAEILANKNDVQILMRFLDNKSFKSETINVPVYERLVALMKNIDTNGTHKN